MRLRGHRAAVLIGLLVLSSLARADTHCAVVRGGDPSLERVDASVRLRYIQGSLQHGARRARIWSWTWATAYSVSAVTNLALAVSIDSDARSDRAIAAASSAIGVAFLGILPLKIMRDQRWLDRRIANARADTDPCALVADAERLLIRDAASEAFGRGPLVHVGTFLLNVGIAMLMTLAYGRAEQGMLVGLIGIGVGEVQIATQPTDAITDLEHYRANELDRPRWRHDRRWAVTPMLGHEQYGLTAVLGF